MKKKLSVVGVSLVVMLSLGLVASFASASAKQLKPAGTTSCTYGEYNQYGECCTYGEYSQYGECCTYGEYSQYCEPASPSGGTKPGPPQTIGPGAKPAGVTWRTFYHRHSTVVDVKLPAGFTVKKFYLYTVKGVFFGDRSYKLLKKDILAYNGSKPLSYSITKLSLAHGQVHLAFKNALASPTFKVGKNAFKSTQKHISKTLVSIAVTSTTGRVYTVRFKALYGAALAVHYTS